MRAALVLLVVLALATPGTAGTIVNPGLTEIGGAVATKVFADSPYTVTAADFTLLVNCTNGAVTITLPAASNNSGRIVTIKKTDATANAVTVARTGADTIDGATAQTIGTQYMALTFQSDGTSWWVI